MIVFPIKIGSLVFTGSDNGNMGPINTTHYSWYAIILEEPVKTLMLGTFILPQSLKSAYLINLSLKISLKLAQPLWKSASSKRQADIAITILMFWSFYCLINIFYWKKWLKPKFSLHFRYSELHLPFWDLSWVE